MEKIKPKKKPRGVPLSKATGVKYNAQLQNIVREIHKDIRVELLPILKQLQREYQADAYSGDVISAIERLVAKWTSPLFKSRANVIASAFVRTANQTNESQFKRDFGVNALTEPTGLQEYLTTSVYENVNLIESLPSSYLDQVRTIVTQNVRAGNRYEDVARELQTRLGVSQRRAKLIARDQTAKIAGDLSERRQRAVGFGYFKWSTSRDAKVRDRHADIARRKTKYGIGVYKWDELPKSDSGKRIKPGDDFQCRCVAIPVSDAQVRLFQKKS